MAYTGFTILLPVGAQGFSGARNQSKMGPGHFSFVDGVDLEGGDLVKEGGAAKLNSTALGSGAIIRAGINWSPAPGEQHDVVMLGNGTVLKDTGAGTFPTTLITGLTDNVEPPPFFFTGGGEGVGSTRKLFLCSAGHQMQYVSGTANTMQAITGAPADWASAFPTVGVLHANRIFAAGNANDPHRLYYTAPGDHLVYTGAATGTISVYPGEGTTIAGLMSFRGLLVIWKYPKGIYTIDTRNPDVATWTAQPVTRAVGAVNAQSIIQIENDILYMDAAGFFHLLSATQDLGDVNTSNISEQVATLGNFIRDNISLTNIRRSHAVYYGANREAWFMMPKAGSTSPDFRFSIDFNELQLGPRFLTHRRDTGIRSMWMRPGADKVEKPVQGDGSGFVWLMDQEARNKDGAAYDTIFETANTNFAFAAPELAFKTKNFHFLELTVDLLKNTTITVTPFIDNIASEPILFEIGGASVGLDNFILDTHALGVSGVVNVRKRMPGSGRNLKLRLQNSILNDENRISEFHVAFGVGDERGERTQ